MTGPAIMYGSKTFDAIHFLLIKQDIRGVANLQDKNCPMLRKSGYMSLDARINSISRAS